MTNTDYHVQFSWQGRHIEIKYKSEAEFLEMKRRSEEMLIIGLRNGVSLEQQGDHWGDLLDQYWEDFANCDDQKFAIGIVICKKLKVSIFGPDAYYGWDHVPTPKKRNFRPCKVCEKVCATKCPCCRKAYYCCEAHQRSDWKEHKKTCVGRNVLPEAAEPEDPVV